MTIDPKVSAILNLIVAIAGFLAASAALLTPIFGDSATHTIVAVCGLLVGLWSAVNAALHGVSSPEKGPLA